MQGARTLPSIPSGLSYPGKDVRMRLPSHVILLVVATSLPLTTRASSDEPANPPIPAYEHAVKEYYRKLAAP